MPNMLHFSEVIHHNLFLLRLHIMIMVMPDVMICLLWSLQRSMLACSSMHMSSDFLFEFKFKHAYAVRGRLVANAQGLQEKGQRMRISTSVNTGSTQIPSTSHLQAELHSQGGSAHCSNISHGGMLLVAQAPNLSGQVLISSRRTRVADICQVALITEF